MSTDHNARRERIAAQVFAVRVANHNNVSNYDHARAAFIAADAFLKVSEEWYGSTEPDAASPSLLEAAKEMVEAIEQKSSVEWRNMKIAALRAAIAREEVARG